MSIIVCLCLFSVSLGQEPLLDKAKWDDLKEEVQFPKSKSKAKTEREEAGSGDGPKSAPVEDSSSGTVINLGPLMQIVIVILFVVFLAALLFAIFSNISFKKGAEKVKSDPDDVITDIEENFTKDNLEKWLRYAREQNDYYLVLRIQFLMILKSLETQRLILWKKNKTNWNYISELSTHHYQTEFKKLVNDFDQVWYGEKSFSEETLKGKISQFENFKEQIDRS